MHDGLSGACSHPAIPSPHAVEVGGKGRPYPQQPTMWEYCKGVRDRAVRARRKRCDRLSAEQKSFAEDKAFDTL